MDNRNYTKVIIDGREYHLAGQEEEGYLQKLAAHINQTITGLKQQGALQKQTMEIRNLQIFLQLADDYLRQKEAAEKAELHLQELETQNFELKHNLVTAQMQLEQYGNIQEEAQQFAQRLSRAEEREQSLQTQAEDLRAQIRLLEENNQALEKKNRALSERYTQLRNQVKNN